MSCVCILTPLILAAWPEFREAVEEAANSLGYTILDEISRRTQKKREVQGGGRSVTLEIEQSEIITNQLERDQRIRVTRAGATVTFSRDAHGKASVCVSGQGYTDEQLREIGEELSHRVVQKYVYQRLMDEVKARQFLVVEEDVDETHAIRLKVRHWDNV